MQTVSKKKELLEIEIAPSFYYNNNNYSAVASFAAAVANTAVAANKAYAFD